jgi:hypothetical protein
MDPHHVWWGPPSKCMCPWMLMTTCIQDLPKANFYDHLLFWDHAQNQDHMHFNGHVHCQDHTHTMTTCMHAFPWPRYILGLCEILRTRACSKTTWVAYHGYHCILSYLGASHTGHLPFGNFHIFSLHAWHLSCSSHIAPWLYPSCTLAVP